MQHILIRECTHNDIDEILRLDEQWAQENVTYEFTTISREEFIAGLERFPSYFLVAESEDGIVGYINGAVHLNQGVAVIPEQETYLEVENIYVKPDFRNTQIGGRLIDRLLEIAEQNGIQRSLVSTVSQDMDQVLRFYQSHGFKPWYVQMFR